MTASRIIGADEVRVGQRVSFVGTSYEGWIVDEGLLDIVLKAAATGYVFLLSDAPTEDKAREAEEKQEES